MDKILKLTLMYDFYGELLTEKQRTIFDMFYNQDLSLQEIANILNISRQTVHDNIKTSKKKLSEYEEKLLLVEKHFYLQSKISDIENAINSIIKGNIFQQSALENIVVELQNLKST